MANSAVILSVVGESKRAYTFRGRLNSFTQNIECWELCSRVVAWTASVLLIGQRRFARSCLSSRILYLSYAFRIEVFEQWLQSWQLRMVADPSDSVRVRHTRSTCTLFYIPNNHKLITFPPIQYVIILDVLWA